MPTFPQTPKPRMGTAEKKSYVVIRAKFEGNYTQVRRGATRSKSTFSLSYDAITGAEFDTFKAFFDTYAGSIFDFIHPSTGVTHKVVFANDDIAKKYLTPDRFNVQIDLEEV